MKMRSFFFLLLTSFFLSCSHIPEGASDWEFSEVFQDYNKPVFEYNNLEDAYLLSPWNYELGSNSFRRYPLVVYLHGSGGSGSPAGLWFLGYNNDEAMKRYPCFVFVPHTEGNWEAGVLISQIEKILSSSRIDNSRLYLIGYSMGASGAYSLANAYYDYSGQLFAGIIRLAGESRLILRDPVAQKTSVWFHVGLLDTSPRITAAREAYEYLKVFHSPAAEKYEELVLEGHPGNTITLYKRGVEVALKSEYTSDGHGVSSFPFRDPRVMAWLFKQDLDNR